MSEQTRGEMPPPMDRARRAGLKALALGGVAYLAGACRSAPAEAASPETPPVRRLPTAELGRVEANPGDMVQLTDGSRALLIRDEVDGAPTWLEVGMGVLNVKNMGAVGDGKQDDTEAIQAALNQARRMARTYGTKDTTVPGLTQYLNYSPTIFFPPGTYRISKALTNPNPCVQLISDSRAIILQTNPDEDIFSFKLAMHVRMEGLTLVGGRRQLYYDNGNLNAMTLTVRDVDFFNSTGFALSIGSVARAMNDTCSSTFAFVGNCRFIGCYQAILNCADTATLDQVWIEPEDDRTANAGMVVNRGNHLRVRRLMAIPNLRRNVPEQAHWFSNYGNRIEIADSRFGYETPQGLPIVHQFASPLEENWWTKGGRQYPYIAGTGIFIDNCQISMGRFPQSEGVIRLKGGVPEQIVIRNIYYLVRENRPFITSDPEFNLDEFFRRALDTPGARPLQFNFRIQDIAAWGPVDLAADDPARTGLPYAIKQRLAR